MNQLITSMKLFPACEDGATMVEYGLMIALIAAVCIAAVTSLGNSLNTQFNTVGTAVGGAGT